MISAILFDLDGTLLDNDIARFLPAYLQSLGGFLEGRISPARFREAIHMGTRAMQENGDPEITLQQAFDRVFFPHIGIERKDLETGFERYYAECFPALKELTGPVEAAVQAVDRAFELRWKVAVATNPLFPLTAVLQRLEWAGLDPRRTCFDLISSYESLHFAKPRPEFAAEVLGRITAQPGEAVFVGDDEALDLRPARALGLATFHAVRSPSADPPEDRGAGTMRQLAAGLETDHCETSFLLAADPSPCALPALLSGYLAAVLHEFSESRWTSPPQEEGWGPVEIACHLRDVEREITQPRLRKILDQKNPYLAPVESDPWAEERDYRSQDGPQALQDFVRARKETIALLRNLAAADWRRSARHALFGPTTLAEQARFSSRHDLLHIDQLRGSLAAAGE